MGDFARNKLYYVLNLVLIAPCSILVWRGLWEMGQGLWLVPSRCLRKDPHDCTEHAALMAKASFICSQFFYLYFRKLVKT